MPRQPRKIHGAKLSRSVACSPEPRAVQGSNHVMKMLFALHCLHPNPLEIQRVMSGSGDSCVCIVAQVRPSEPELCGDRILLDGASVTVKKLQVLMAKIGADVLVHRNFEGNLLGIWKSLRDAGVMTFRYTQDPQQIPYLGFFRPLRAVRFARDLLFYRAKPGIRQVRAPATF